MAHLPLAAASDAGQVAAVHATGPDQAASVRRAIDRPGRTVRKSVDLSGGAA